VRFGDALAWLDAHQNLERMLADSRLAVPDLSRMQRLMDLMDEPQRACPVIRDLHQSAPRADQRTAYRRGPTH
jgi:hypothetical protein